MLKHVNNLSSTQKLTKALSDFDVKPGALVACWM